MRTAVPGDVLACERLAPSVCFAIDCTWNALKDGSFFFFFFSGSGNKNAWCVLLLWRDSALDFGECSSGPLSCFDFRLAVERR